MKYVTTWTWRQGGSAKDNEDTIRRVLEVFQSGRHQPARRSTNS